MGGAEVFRQSCQRDKCELYAYVAMPNLALWEWYERLITRQRAGLEGHVDSIVSSLDETMITAFVAFRAELLAGLGGDAHG